MERARYTTIYVANEDKIVNPDCILPGQIFGLRRTRCPTPRRCIASVYRANTSRPTRILKITGAGIDMIAGLFPLILLCCIVRPNPIWL